MAAVQQRLQAHSKTRSGQLASSSNRPLQPQSREAPHAQQGPSSHHGAIPIASPLSLFLTNLKLLDLDLLEGWPGISHETFATASVNAQGQKKRIQCVEWALFHLFALWEPDETASVSHLSILSDTVLTTTETQTLLPAPRPSPISQPPRRPPTMSRICQEERRPRPRYHNTENHDGRVQRGTT